MVDDFDFQLPDLSDPSNQAQEIQAIPGGRYTVRVASCKPGIKHGVDDNGNPTKKGQFEISLKVVKPEKFKGRSIREWLYLTPKALPRFSAFLAAVGEEEASRANLSSIRPIVLAQRVVGRVLDVETEVSDRGFATVKFAGFYPSLDSNVFAHSSDDPPAGTEEEAYSVFKSPEPDSKVM